ncbi:hypothetical protein [Halobacteriovorax sp. DPLXC-1]|uniref:hypothetical protein n=1 Tax=Halobacteriovorax sp. DPLXC-1 TaxID=3110771 RepID=UPI002FF2C86D
MSVFRDYNAIRRLGFKPINSEDRLNPNESFRRDFEKFTLTFYSWRDVKFVGHSVDYGYRGLYMAMDYIGEKPSEFELINDLFDKYDEEENAIIFFKEGWNIDEKDLPRLIRKIYKRLGIHSSTFGLKFFRSSDTPQRHYRNTKLDYGKHLKNNKITNFAESLFKVAPQVVLVAFINLFFENEFGRMVGIPSSGVNDLIATILTFIIAGNQFSKAKYWSLDKGISKKKLFHIFQEEKVYAILGVVFILIGISKLVLLAKSS